MPKHPFTEIEVYKFAGTDAELLVKLENWAREGEALVAIHDQDGLRYLYLRRIIAPGRCHPYEQQRINIGSDNTVNLNRIIRRELEAGWNLGTVYRGEDGMIQVFFFRLVAPPDIEEKG